MKVFAMAVTNATLKLHVRVTCKDINHPNMKVSNMAVTNVLAVSNMVGQQHWFKNAKSKQNIIIQ